MKLLFCIFCTLLVAAQASPNRYKREGAIPRETLHEILEFIAKMKNPDTYDALRQKLDERWAEKENDMAHLEGEAKERALELREPMEKFREVMYIVLDIAKVTLVEGAKPTEKELTELGKRLAKAWKESERTMKEVIPQHLGWLGLTPEVIAALQEIVVQNPIKESGNNFLDILKEKIPELYMMGKELKDDNEVSKKCTDDLACIKPERTMEVVMKHMVYLYGLASFELSEVLSSEEAVINTVKTFGVITSTLKSASSYDSLKALYDGFARSKELEAYNILIREAAKCFSAPLTDDEKAEFLQHLEKVLPIWRMFLADGVVPDEGVILSAMDSFKENDDPVLQRLVEKMTTGGTEARKRFLQCLVSEADRKAFKEAITMKGPIFTDEQLGEIKGKNEKVYAVIYLINDFAKAIRQIEGLGAEADAFYKEMQTTPKYLLKIAEYSSSPSQETRDLVEANKKVIIQKFNALSADAKKELVAKFPYQALFYLSTLD